MNQQIIIQTITVAAALLMLAGSARADNVQCRSEQGSDADFDASCIPTETFKPIPAPIPLSAASLKAALQIVRFVEAEKERALACADRRARNLSKSSDAATLQAARFALAEMDRANALARQQAQAEQKNTAGWSWKFWRS